LKELCFHWLNGIAKVEKKFELTKKNEERSYIFFSLLYVHQCRQRKKEYRSKNKTAQQLFRPFCPEQGANIRRVLQKTSTLRNIFCKHLSFVLAPIKRRPFVTAICTNG